MASWTRGRRRARPLVLVFVCLLTLGNSGGCSFIFVTPRPPAPPPPPQRVECTTNYVDPVVDTVLAALGGMVSLLVFEGPCLDVCEDGRTKGIILSLPFFVLPTASAIYGYSKVGACRAAR